MKRNWYQIRAAVAQARAAEIFLYDEIGQFGITAADFVTDLKALGQLDEITLRINSPGGECAQGVAIYNVLKGSPATVTVVVDGIAASMASVVAMAGDRVLMPSNAMMMVHEPSGLVCGNSRDMRETADIMDEFGDSLLSAYTSKTAQTAERIQEMMRAETWMSAEEAVSFGFADEVVAPMAIAASFDLSRFDSAAAGRAMARANMQRTLAFRSGKAPEHKLKEMAATAVPSTDSPARASMKKLLPQVSKAEGGIGRAGSSSRATSSMRLQLERMGIATLDEGA